jgi:hypothetical protein
MCIVRFQFVFSFKIGEQYPHEPPKVGWILNYGIYCSLQCCGSMNSVTDPAIFVSALQDVNNNKKLFCLLLFEGTFTSFFKEKSHTELTKK